MGLRRQRAAVSSSVKNFVGGAKDAKSLLAIVRVTSTGSLQPGRAWGILSAVPGGVFGDVDFVHALRAFCRFYPPAWGQLRGSNQALFGSFLRRPLEAR